MHRIQRIQNYNKSELEKCVAPEASWHRDYKDTAYIYIGGLPLDLSEGDIITIFSQYGEPVWFKLARDKETGKSRGFGWLKYEDQRSCDLAVDNLGGASFMGRLLNVDHTRYEPREDENVDEFNVAPVEVTDGKDETEGESEVEEKPLLKEEMELLELLKNAEGEGEEDPMMAYMIEQKRKEVAKAKEKLRKRQNKERRHRHHRSRKDGSDEDKQRDRRHRDHAERERDSSDDGYKARHRHSRREREQDSGEERHRNRRRDRERSNSRERRMRDQPRSHGRR